MNTRHIAAGLCAGLTLMICSTAHAQAPGDSADELIRDADAVLVQFDEGDYSGIWDNAADFIKKNNSEPQFIANMQKAHDRIGPVRRTWGSVVRVRYSGAKDIPDGLYGNVDFVSNKVGGGTVFEKLSFRLEADGHWHLTGYSPRDSRGNTF